VETKTKIWSLSARKKGEGCRLATSLSATSITMIIATNL
jgi:hypothetical protein